MDAKCWIYDCKMLDVFSHRHEDTSKDWNFLEVETIEVQKQIRKDY